MNGAVSLESKPLSRRVALANARRIVVLGCALGLLLFVGVHAGREFTSLVLSKKRSVSIRVRRSESGR